MDQYDTFWNGKAIKIPANYTIILIWRFYRYSEGRPWRCIAGLTSCKETASGHLYGQGNAAYQIPVDVLIWLSIKTTSGIAAALGVTTSLNLQQSTVILQYPSVFCSGQMGELNGDVVEIITLDSFKSLMMALISVNPPGMKPHFLFSIFLGRVSFSVSTWPISP